MILLYHERTTHGSIATPEGRVGGEYTAAPRRYAHEGHFVAVDGAGSAHVADYYAREILKIPGYRLATPAEQNDYHRTGAQAGALQEMQATTDPEEDAPPAEEAPATVRPTTLTTETAPRPPRSKKG